MPDRELAVLVAAIIVLLIPFILIIIAVLTRSKKSEAYNEVMRINAAIDGIPLKPSSTTVLPRFTRMSGKGPNKTTAINATLLVIDNVGPDMPSDCVFEAVAQACMDLNARGRQCMGFAYAQPDEKIYLFAPFDKAATVDMPGVELFVL